MMHLGSLVHVVSPRRVSALSPSYTSDGDVRVEVLDGVCAMEGLPLVATSPLALGVLPDVKGTRWIIQTAEVEIQIRAFIARHTFAQEGIWTQIYCTVDPHLCIFL